MFSAWPEFDLDDLFHEALAAIRRGHERYDPNYRTPSGKRVAYVTFAYMCGARRLLDLWRARGRRANTELAYRLALPRAARPATPAERRSGDGRDLEQRTDAGALAGDDAPPLADWLAQAFVKARYAHRPEVVKRGRKWFSVPHCVAAVLLMRRLKLSCRAAAELLSEREDLRRAMRLTRAPSHVWFHRARRIVRVLEKRQRGRVPLRSAPAEPLAA